MPRKKRNRNKQKAKKRAKLVFYVNSKDTQAARKSKAHIWNGTDTRCGIIAAGVIKNQDHYEISQSAHSRGLCWNCVNGVVHGHRFIEDQHTEPLVDSGEQLNLDL